MPPEPKNKIEELLEASAQKRRAEFGRDPAMPNPMRVRLHEEIAAITGNREPVPHARPFWLAAADPRRGLCVSGRGWRLASLADAATDTERNGALRGSGSAGIGRAPACGVERTSEAKNHGLFGRRQIGPRQSGTRGAGGLATFSQAAAAGAIAEKSETAASANPIQQFSQVAADQAVASRSAHARSPQVLANFQVEQNGRDIRVVDEDGSTYRGRIEELPPNDSRNVRKLKQAATMTAEAVKQAPAERDGQTANNEFHFRASGYNDRLQKSLVFEGNYMADASAGRKDLPAEGQKKNAPAPARILGTAKIAGQPPVSIDAVTVPAK